MIGVMSLTQIRRSFHISAAIREGQHMARIVAFSNQKGGVAKSTTVEAFAAELTARGFRVLMVDMDAQPGNLSLHVGADKERKGSGDMLLLAKPTEGSVSDCIQDAGGFGDIVAADERLDTVDDRLNSRVGRERILDRALATIQSSYDFILVDTPPSLQVRTLNALAAADDVIIPTRADLSSVAGVSSVLDVLYDIMTVTSHDIDLVGIALADWDPRLSLAKEDRGARVLGRPVRHATAAAQAQRHGEPLRVFAPSSTVHEDYRELVSAYLAEIGFQ